jgi:hypothetical protein
MSNTLLKGQTWASVLQSQLRESFVGKYIADTKFEGEFNKVDTVHFERQAKITLADMASSYDEVPVQDIIQSDETFTPVTRKAFSVRVSDEDYKLSAVSPDSQVMKDSVEAFARAYDDAIFAQYTNAGITVTDGDMSTATNGGTTNSIICTKSNMYDLITAVGQKLDAANVTDSDRWIVLDPKRKRFLMQAPELLRSTDMGDKVVTGGTIGMVDNFKIYWSNRTVLATSRFLLAGQGKPICFAAITKPAVTFVGQETQANNWNNFMKANSRFGAKTFSEGAERLVSIKISD